jgi:hypothetical protein
MLKTGSIGVSETKNTSVMKGEDENKEEDDEGWMSVEEVEAGEWDVIHIQCPEDTEDKEEEDSGIPQSVQ